MKLKIIFAFGAILVVSLVFMMKQRQNINELEGSLENTIQQLENNHTSDHGDNDDGYVPAI